MVRTSIPLLLCLAAASPAARADFIFATCTTAGPVSMTAAAPNIAQALACPQFNSGLGTLNNYSIANFNGALPLSGTFTILNTNAQAATFPGLSVAGLSLSMTLTGFPGLSTPLLGNGPGRPNGGAVSIGAGSSQTFAVAFGAPGFSVVNLTGSLASYIGTGSIPISVAFTSAANTGGLAPSGFTATNWSILADAVGVTVIYDYTPGTTTPPASPTPEPSTFVLALSGAGLLLAARRSPR